jgi:hypothetical protein
MEKAWTATVPYKWVMLADRMDPGFWLLVSPEVERLMAGGLDETSAVLRASREYREQWRERER